MVKINTATYNILRRAQNPGLAEKDYIECVVLDTLFSNAYIGDNFVFAGGASLSKTYQLSMRIGQDIDLVCTEFEDIPDNHSRKQLEKFKKHFKYRVFDEIKQKIGEIINPEQQFLILTDQDWRMLKNTESFMTSPTLHLMYKSEFSPNLGHLSIEVIPRKYPEKIIAQHSVVPYSIGQSIGNIPTVRFEQTFWDKVYALHSNAVASRPHSNQFYSRHYYDVAILYGTNNIDLPGTQSMLFDIERHQAKYTLKNIAPLGTPANVQLIPDSETLEKLGNDYDQMADKFLGARTDWAKIINNLASLGHDLKKLQGGR